MEQYKCESCGRTLNEPWCEKCQLEAKPFNAADLKLNEIGAAAIQKEAASRPPRPDRQPPPKGLPQEEKKSKPAPPPPDRSWAARAEESASAPPEPITAPRRETPRPQPPAAPERKTVVGLTEFHALLEEGYETVVMCGTGKTGKSQIVNGFTRANTIVRGRAQISTLRSASQKRDVLGGTLYNSVWYQIVHTGSNRKRIFLDPSGEFFKMLVPAERQRLELPELTEDFFDFVAQGAKHLAGLVLVVDLSNPVDETGDRPWADQEDNLLFILPALRWLHFDTQARRPEIGVDVNISQRVESLPRFDVPVLVLFSKADQVTHFTNERPLDFAQHYLPVLHGAVMTHAKHFHYDFCHTMVRTGTGDEPAIPPCGVLLSMEWLLDPPPLSWMPRLPANWLGGGA